MRANALCALIGSVIPAVVLAADERAKPLVNAIDVFPVEAGNKHYIGNREPLMPSPLFKLPIGAVRPEGWLRGQLELLADGMIGHLTEISPWCEFKTSAWVDPHGQGKNGWEELPYWLKGFIDLGYVLEDERIISEAKKWVEAVLASQRPDGYFGAEANRENSDLWPNMVMLYALRTYHEKTGDFRVIQFMTKYFKWQTTVPLEKFLPGSWQKIRGGDNLDSIYWLYNRTGGKWLLDLARVCHEMTAQWTQGFPTWHGVNITQAFREPGQFWQQAGDVRYLQSSENRYQTAMDMYGQVPGGMFGADENARPGFTGPRQGAESCSIIEFMYSFEYLLKATGDGMWADHCEEVAFNSLPCAMTPDYKGLHYLTAPNQVQLDRASKSPLIQNGGDMFSYTPYEQYRCCQHNISHGWPYYSEHLWLATAGNGLAAAMYAPSSVKAKVGADGTEVTVSEKTEYPFGERVELTLATAKPVHFPLALRVPRWCEGFAVTVNGARQKVTAKPLQWVTITQEWRDGDLVEIELPMQITATVWAKNRNTVSIHRGPLSYSLKIGERWAKYDTGRSWPGFEVFPTTPWNYGLIVDTKKPSASFELVRSGEPVGPQPFTPDAAPLALKGRGKRLPDWKLEPNGLIGEIQQSPVSSDEPEEAVTLIPMGCARLRVSAFPMIGEGVPPAAPAAPSGVDVSASVTGPSDTLAALSDGIVPTASNDTRVPRFTWWENRGSGQWVEYRFHEYRRLSWSEVFWFDDSGIGGCRTPLRWRLLYAEGKRWKDVKATGDYGAAKDKFNRVTFEPVTTNRIRLFAEFQPEYSAGILEWRVGE